MIDVNKCVALRVRYYRTVADYYCATAEFARTQNNTILARRENIENLQSNS